MYTRPTAPPCLGCATTGGYIPRDHRRPARKHGLCSACCIAAKRRGVYHLYPACGPRPVRRLISWHASQPAPLPAVVFPAQIGIADTSAPPTDPGWTARRMRLSANQYAAHALDWLQRPHKHLDAFLAANPHQTLPDALAAVAWGPAEAARREAA